MTSTQEYPPWLGWIVGPVVAIVFSLLVMYFKGVFKRIKYEAAGEKRDVVGDVLLKNAIERLEETRKKTDTMITDITEIKIDMAEVKAKMDAIQESFRELKGYREENYRRFDSGISSDTRRKS